MATAPASAPTTTITLVTARRGARPLPAASYAEANSAWVDAPASMSEADMLADIHTRLASARFRVAEPYGDAKPVTALPTSPRTQPGMRRWSIRLTRVPIML